MRKFVKCKHYKLFVLRALRAGQCAVTAGIDAKSARPLLHCLRATGKEGRLGRHGHWEREEVGELLAQPGQEAQEGGVTSILAALP